MSNLPFLDQASFMRLFGQRMGEPDVANLYRSLVDEEHGELVAAWAALCDDPINPEKVAEVADGAIDLIYVLIGLLHGLGLNPQALWDEVHQSNVAKAKHLCTACNGTGYIDAGDDEQACPACQGQGYKWEVQRREDGKVIKPPGWQPPNLSALVRAQLGHPART